jgi:hypothetical protein
MHKATKAALLSAFIFPGCGHFYLKNKRRGAVFFLFSVGCLFVLIKNMIKIADIISNGILSGDIPLNIASLMAEISSQLSGTNSNLLNIVSLLLVICWGVATIDSFILGRKLLLPVLTK